MFAENSVINASLTKKKEKSTSDGGGTMGGFKQNPRQEK